MQGKSNPRRTRSRYPSIYYRDTPDGRAYEVTFRDHHGRQRWERIAGTDNVEAARDTLALRQGKTRKGERTPPAGTRFREVRERYQSSAQFTRLGGWTRKNYLASLNNVIGPRFDNARIGTIDAAAVAQLTVELEQRKTPNGQAPRQSTVENTLLPLRGVLRQAVKDGLISASPFTMLDRDDRPAPDEQPHRAHEWTDIEVDRLLAASSSRAHASESRYDYAPLLAVASKAGLRLGEILGLDWPDLELAKGKGMIHVRRQWTRLHELRPPKAGSRRDVPIPDELVRLLLELKMKAVDKTGPVFASRTGGRLSHRNVQRRGFDPAAADAGLTDVTFHDLRHAYGSRLASKGLTARQIADALGHKKTSTTEIYLQRYNGAQADARVRQAMSG
jgi:integrase